MKDRMTSLLFHDHRFYGAKLHAFVVMSNHIHLVSQLPPDHDGSWFLQRIKTNSSKELIPLLTDEERYELSQQIGLNGRLFWKRSFRSLVIPSPHAFHQKISYIHENPVRANLVSLPSEYLWSSARFTEEGLWNPEEGLPLNLF